MSGSGHALFILAAYGVSLVLLGAEVWLLVRRSRAHPPREPLRGPHDEA